MAFDVSKHELVPKHSKLSDADKKKLLERFNVSEKSLPRILKSDPGIASLNVKVGDVVQIERPSRTAGTAYYFRVVAEE